MNDRVGGYHAERSLLQMQVFVEYLVFYQFLFLGCEGANESSSVSFFRVQLLFKYMVYESY